MAASLGVECNFCHVEGEFEKDDKEPKATASKMMLMRFAINKNNRMNSTETEGARLDAVRQNFADLKSLFKDSKVAKGS